MGAFARDRNLTFGADHAIRGAEAGEICPEMEASGSDGASQKQERWVCDGDRGIGRNGLIMRPSVW